MEEKRILIEFIGGDWDGKTIDSHSPEEEDRHHVQTCLHMTRNGTVGKAFHGMSMQSSDQLARGEITFDDTKRPEGRRTHKYTVVERLDVDDEVLIRMRYSVRDPSREKKAKQ